MNASASSRKTFSEVENMETSSPIIPNNITVHLGSPDSNASNVTVPFVNYVKNVVSSEIYPTWDFDAIKANTLAITSFALNRVFTEYYRSRGKNFDITSSTAIDQKFINGRNIFENISTIVDTLYDDYIRRIGFIEPLAAKFCNGTTVTCNGLSQWGSQDLAEAGYDWLSILRNYYGNNIEIVQDAPSGPISPTYPGTPLRRGSRGTNVGLVQTMLNRISQAYPAIPKLNPVDGIFGENTENAVTRFQQIFNLTPDGIVGRNTWYEMVRLYYGLLRLSELNSEGLRLYGMSWEYPDAIRLGDSGDKVYLMQYMLSVISEFYNTVPEIVTDGVFGQATLDAVKAFQRLAGLPEDGIVGPLTWDQMYSFYDGIEVEVMRNNASFPYLNDPAPPSRPTSPASADVYELLSSMPVNAALSRATNTSRAQSNGNGLPNEGPDRTYSDTSRFIQYPGYILKIGVQDMEE